MCSRGVFMAGPEQVTRGESSAAAATAAALPLPPSLDKQRGGRRRSPQSWLGRLLRGAQAVAEEQPVSDAAADEEEDEAGEAGSDSGADAGVRQADSFGGLPEHLLEKIFGHLRGANRKHHFAICGVSRQWRRVGRQMFFSRPWEVAHLICHPTQLFCLSPRLVTGSRSGLLKCFVRREQGPGAGGGGGGGRRFTFHIGKDAAQPQRSRFLMAAKQGGRDEMLLFLNSRCRGAPCARLRCNLWSTQYKLRLSEELQLEEPSSDESSSCCEAAAAPSLPGGHSGVTRLASWGAEAAAEAVAAALAATRLQQQQGVAAGLPAQQRRAGQQQQHGQQQLGPDCLAELHYQARVKGFMQPRRMRIVLPHPSRLFYDQQLPVLQRRPSGDAASHHLARSSAGTSSAAASPAASPQPRAGRGLGAVAVVPGGGRGVQQPQQPQPQQQQVVLHNKSPHWNEALRCWCLNFRGRVKLASVKNFQLVRADDPGQRVVMQFGKAEVDSFILDFNPTVLTALQAFSIACTTFDSKMLL